ncbi:hypothetical protein AB3466_17805 [Sphingobacterium thalpophilum]|uniref:hypothetical protein n=1 Tax=Sphingobacterium thalpophilum TaxID=259 RepID=UPI0037D9EA99
MKKKTKLAFEELERELSLISIAQMFNVLGGTSFGSGNDCVLYAIAFATGKSYQEVYDAFGAYAANEKGWGKIEGASGVFALIGSNSGIDLNLAIGFANSVGFGSSGDLSGDANTSTSGNVAVVYLDYGNGNGHAVVVTAHDGVSGYYYHDPQNGTNGMLSKNDPRIAAFLQ